ncbi:FMN reductase [Paraburkholderia sacchari]|uniref:FMN reductase n=1 Tax=Paraburkholderia sacchari TaxID=159450 RepID=UPI000541BC8C|nr:FMN reductase [Paraburkholderia sacchari]NLP63611.1 FMN reductase [Paraburkholderia sacchari]
MSSVINLVVVSGSPFRPSRTDVLLNALSAALERVLPVRTRVVALADIAADIGTVLSRERLPGHVEDELRAIEQADILLAGAPVYRGSLPGLFKHLFDLIGIDALAGKPVLIAATGGSQRHALVVDHQLRPLFSFFQSLVLPTGVYATPDDFTDYDITDSALKSRIELVIDQALPVLNGLFPDARFRSAETLAA